MFIRAKLRHTAFRALTAGSSIHFIGHGLQAVSTAWPMLEFTGASFRAGLMQTAVFLPMFLMALPPGVLADTTARRG